MSSKGDLGERGLVEPSSLRDFRSERGSSSLWTKLALTVELDTFWISRITAPAVVFFPFCITFRFSSFSKASFSALKSGLAKCFWRSKLQPGFITPCNLILRRPSKSPTCVWYSEILRTVVDNLLRKLSSLSFSMSNAKSTFFASSIYIAKPSVSKPHLSVTLKFLASLPKVKLEFLRVDFSPISLTPVLSKMFIKSNNQSVIIIILFSN